jgi:hypothetical protein
MFNAGRVVEIEVERWTPMRLAYLKGLPYFVDIDSIWLKCIYIKALGDKHHIRHHTHDMVIDNKTKIRG